MLETFQEVATSPCESMWSLFFHSMDYIPRHHLILEYPVESSGDFQVVITEKKRKETGIKRGDKMITVSKHKVLHYVPVKSIKDTKGISPGLDTKHLRDENDSD